MKRTHEGQKKPQKERSQTKEISELKRENHKLKRELSRLRKQVLHLLDVSSGSDLETSPDERNLAGSNGTMPACESCGSHDLATVDLPIGTLVVCKSCKHRKKKE